VEGIAILIVVIGTGAVDQFEPQTRIGIKDDVLEGWSILMRLPAVADRSIERERSSVSALRKWCSECVCDCKIDDV
jgi:hypothetical protein